MILGSYSASVYFLTSSIFLAITLVVIYWISQYYGHDKPFPQAAISSVAKHFPEYVFFRTATISGSALVILGWMTNLMYLKTVAYEQVVNLHPYKLNIMTTIGIVGSISLMGSTALIDTGKENVHLHQKCAQVFFIMTIIAQLYNTVVCTLLWKKQNILNKYLVYTKLILAGLFIIQIYLSAQSGQYVLGDEITSDKGNFYQWTVAYTICAYYFVMGLDVRNFNFVYENYTKVNRENQRELREQSEQIVQQ